MYCGYLQARLQTCFVTTKTIQVALIATFLPPYVGIIPLPSDNHLCHVIVEWVSDVFDLAKTSGGPAKNHRAFTAVVSDAIDPVEAYLCHKRFRSPH